LNFAVDSDTNFECHDFDFYCHDYYCYYFGNYFDVGYGSIDLIDVGIDSAGMMVVVVADKMDDWKTNWMSSD